jgi:3',5'-cyclic AMP phosphodiesterase CpdA
MKIIHFSDLHASLPPEDFSAFFDKRVVGFFNHVFRRQFQHNLDFLKKSVDFIITKKPDVVVCTGDFTTTGQPSEFRQVIEILKPIIEDGNIEFFAVPGNHDAYVKNSTCSEALQLAIKNINSSHCQLTDMPFSICVEDTDFLLLNECRPTNIFMSSGYLQDKDISVFNKWLDTDIKHSKVVVGHFPLLHKYSKFDFRHRIYGHESICKALEEKQVDLSLCGHIHKKYTNLDIDGRGEICSGSLTRFSYLSEISFDPGFKNFYHQFIKINLN